MAQKENNNWEIEVRFLEIDYRAFLAKLQKLGAIDLGQDLLREIIFYDSELKQLHTEGKIVKIRQGKNGNLMTFKSRLKTDIESREIEFEIGDAQKATDFLEELGLVAFRRQEKRRHKLKLGEVIIDIDTWPSVPTYVELEGPTEESLREAAEKLGLDWANVITKSPRFIIEEKYGIPISKLHFFTFSKIE